jgi:hypothetical protein
MTEQEKREKVIKGLETCEISGIREDCEGYGCPYFIYNDVVSDECQVNLFSDTLALLKAQEPQGTPEAEWLLYKGMRGATCSYCKHTFDDVYDVENYDYYCRHCGAKMIRMRAVKWK